MVAIEFAHGSKWTRFNWTPDIPPPPPPPPPGSYVGINHIGAVNYSQNTTAAWTAMNTRCGGTDYLKSRRYYYSTLPPNHWDTSKTYADMVGHCQVTLSVKPSGTWTNTANGGDDTILLGFLSSVPATYQLVFVIHHEPDGGGGNGQYEDQDHTTFPAMQRHVRMLVNQANTSRQLANPGGFKPILFGPIFMEFSLIRGNVPGYPNPSGNPVVGYTWMDQWYAGDGVWDFIGFDNYSTSTQPRTVASVFGHGYGYSQSKDGGLPVVVGEWGYAGGQELNTAHRVSNVCTITTNGNHGYSVGNSISIQGVDATVDGEGIVITSVPNSTTYVFNSTGATIEGTPGQPKNLGLAESYKNGDAKDNAKCQWITDAIQFCITREYISAMYFHRSVTEGATGNWKLITNNQFLALGNNGLNV